VSLRLFKELLSWLSVVQPLVIFTSLVREQQHWVGSSPALLSAQLLVLSLVYVIPTRGYYQAYGVQVYQFISTDESII